MLTLRKDDQMALPNVMVVSPSLEIQQAFARVLGKCGLAPIVASSASEAQAILEWHSISLIFCSDEMPSDGINGLIQQTRHASNRTPLVIVSRCNEWRHCLNFLRQGALDFVLFPLSQFEVERIVSNALSIVRLRTTEQALSA